MKRGYKYEKEMLHWLDGGEVEKRLIGFDWELVNKEWDFSDTWQYRIAERPKLKWVGLTDDETQDIVFDNLGVESLTGEKMSVYDAFLLGVKASGAKLKEKNT